MKKLLTFAAFVCLLSVSYSQQIEWKKCFGGSNEEMAFSIINSNDNGFIIAGNSKSNDGDVSSNNGSSDFWVIKINLDGDIIWENNYGISNYERAYAITQAHDGGYIMAGYRNMIDGQPTNSDFLVVRIDEDGNLMWEESYGGTDFDNARHIIKTNDNGYIVAGISTLSDNFYQKSVRVIKINDSGNIVWEKTFFETNCMNFGSSILTPDNGILFIADDCESDSDYIIVKLDANGNMEWQKVYGGSLADKPAAIKHCEEGGYVIVGSSASQDGDVTNNHGGFDYWVIKIDDNGNLLSSKCFGGSETDQAYDVIQNDSNEFIVVGASLSQDGDVTNNTDKKDYWIINIDSDNEIKWEKCIGDSSGEDIARSVVKASNNNYLLTGYTDSYAGEVSGNHGDYDFWVIKISDNPNFINDPKDRIECKIYPNPSDKSIKIDCENIQEVEINDINGRTVFKSDINLSIIDLSMLSNGLYFVKVKNDKGMVIKKIVIE